MDFSKQFVVFIFLLLQPSSIRPQHQQQQQQNVIEQSSSSADPSLNLAQNLPLSELHNMLNQFLHQLKQTGQKVVVAQPAQLPSPLLFNAATGAAVMGQQQQQQRHNGGDGTAPAAGGGTPSVRPFVPLGHVPLFPSSLLVPTAAHLPPTFRLPATVMEQHKAYPMEGSPSNPPVVVGSPVKNNNNNEQQHSKRAEATTADSANGTMEIVSTTIVAAPPLSISEMTEQNTVSDSPTSTVPDLENTVQDEHANFAATDANNPQQQPKQPQVVAAAVPPPLAVPIEIETANDTTPNVTASVPFALPTEKTPPLGSDTAVTVTETTTVAEDDYASQRQRIFFVPGGVKSIEQNGSRQALTAVDLEAFLRSANVARILSTWNNGTTITNGTGTSNNNNNSSSSPIATQDTKLFLALVERVLEQEVARRLAGQQLSNSANATGDAIANASGDNDNSTQRMSPPQHNHRGTTMMTTNTVVQQVLLPPAEQHQLVQTVLHHQHHHQQQQQQQQGDNDDLELDLEERLLDSQKLLKTANTRLFSLASNEAAEAMALVPTAGGHRDGPVPATQHQQAQATAAHHQQQQKGVINMRRGGENAAPSRTAAPASAAIAEAAAGNKQRRVMHETDYKQREQAEFDRLLDRLRAEQSIADGAELGEKSAGGKLAPSDDADLLLIVPPRPAPSSDTTAVANKWQQQQQQQQHVTPPSLATVAQQLAMTSSAAPVTLAPTALAKAPSATGTAQQPQIGTTDTGRGGVGDGHSGGMMLNRQHQFWSRHGPKTKFERLVEDYRWRLMGQDSQNGLNDLIKALRNSNIGFFDRHSSPSALKILRRVD